MDIKVISSLNDTVNLMRSGDYKDRFIAEYAQVMIRAQKLEKMLIDYRNKALDFIPSTDIDTLTDQLTYMNRYILILQKRAKIESITLPLISISELKSEV